MIKKRYLLLTGLALSLAGSGCQRIETEPRDIYREDTVWDVQDRNAVVALQFLNDLYNYIPNGFMRVGGDFLDAGTDDAVPSRTGRTVEYYTNGTISTILNPDAYWGTSYAGIRKVNIFLANIDKVPTTAENLTWWKSEARFIRALMYFELVKRYGGVPLIGDKIFSLEDDLSVPRNTYADCVAYIVSECDAVKGTLRPEPVSDADWGRVPRGAAYALKSRVLLYAASPLFNGGGVAGSDLLGYPSADPSRWLKAAEAAQEFLTFNSSNAAPYTLQPNFNNVFVVKKNTEIILAKQSPNGTSLENSNAPVGYVTPAASQGLTSPSQNLVDAFPDLNGRPITDAATTYRANNPYAERDPRLALTVFTNGVTAANGTTPVPTSWINRPVELFEGGRDKPGGNAVQTRTGYYLRKFLANFATNSSYTAQSHNFPIFRFAEIRLNAAEAFNEVGTRTQDAVNQIIELRRRAGIMAGADGRYGIPAGIGQAALRELIRNERRIELAFEEHRFWDVRRWKIAETALSGPLNGIKITRTATSPLTYTYERTLVTNLVFQPKLYYMPLPYDETTKNLNLKQNPGW